ncbi:MAG: hypothetical protein ACKVOR_06955 [Flavobacteriales bacterium]
MKTGKVILLLLCVVAICSFRSYDVSKEVNAGVYGTCNCDAEKTTQRTVQLTLNEDFTFHYVDNSDPQNKEDIQGTWAHTGIAILLTGNDGKTPTHNKWKMDKNGKCIKSRRGLEFTRLCVAIPC